MGGFLGALPGLITACLAIYAVSAWRRDFLGRRRIELAEEVLSLFYKARDVILAIRSPGSFGEETQDRKPEPGENDDQRRARDLSFLFGHRYNQHIDLFSKIQATRYQFMARFGTGSVQPFNDIHAVIVQLLVAARTLYSLTQFLQTGLTTQSTLDGVAKCKADLFGVVEPDPIRVKVDKIISDIEAITLPIITARDPLVDGWEKFTKLLMRGFQLVSDRWNHK